MASSARARRPRAPRPGPSACSAAPWHALKGGAGLIQGNSMAQLQLLHQCLPQHADRPPAIIDRLIITAGEAVEAPP